MKRVHSGIRFPVLILAAALLASSTAGAQEQKTKVKTSTEKVKVKTEKTAPDNKDPLPYEPGFSSSFVVVPSDAQMRAVLNQWKGWEDNNSVKYINEVTRDFALTLSGAATVTGREHALDALVRARSEFVKSTRTLETIIPLRSTDKNVQWVAVWGKQVNYGADGVPSMLAIHEIWSFDRFGKIISMTQYTSPMTK